MVVIRIYYEGALVCSVTLEKDAPVAVQVP